MTQLRSYTTIEQSKKLAEILPLESADMWWNYYSVTTDDTTPMIVHLDNPWVGSFNWGNKPDNIPCWSLTALLNAMPQSINVYVEKRECRRTFNLNLFRSYYHCCSYSFESTVTEEDDDNSFICIGSDSWVDACYAMIIRLHEHNLIGRDFYSI